MKKLINKLFTGLLVLLLSPVAVLIVILAKAAFKDFKPKRKRLYLSGRISGLTRFEYVNNFNTAQSKMLRKYPNITVISPIRIKPLFGIHKYWCHMVADVFYLLKSDAVAFMPNWKDSKGARIEMVFTIMTNKEIIML